MVKALLALLALAVVWLLPAGVLAQEDTASGSEDPWGDFGIEEHPLREAPRGTPQADVEQPARLPEPDWPGEHLRENFDFADAYAFPELFPSLAAAYETRLGVVPGDDDAAIFSHRVGLELYALHVGLSLYDALDDDRVGQQIVDLDLRVPFRLSSGLRLALLPGISFDAARLREDAEVRFQGVFGWGSPAASLEARLGYTQGPRAGGVLLADGLRNVSAPAGLFGALAALRPVPAVELRAEVAGEVSGVAPDRLSLLPGAAFYPLGDERVELGLTAVVESRAADFDLDDPAVGALFHLGGSVY